MIIKSTIQSYVEELSSKAPTPGGGSGSAVAALLGISLMEMAVRLTEGKKKYLEFSEDYTAVLALWEAQKEKLIACSDEDAVVFAHLMEVLRNHNQLDEMTQQAAVDVAADGAGRVPLQAGQAIVNALRGAQSIAAQINPWVISDLIGGVEIAMGALRSVLLNTAINIGSIADTQLRTTLQTDMETCLAQGEELYYSLRHTLYATETFASLSSEQTPCK